MSLPSISSLPTSSAGVGQKRPRPRDESEERGAGGSTTLSSASLGAKSAGPSDWEVKLTGFVDNDGKVKPANDIEGFVKLLEDALASDNATFCVELLASITEQKMLSKLVKAGLLNPLRDWLKEASAKQDKKWLSDLLQLLLRLPTDLSALKASKIGVQVAKLSSKGGSGASLGFAAGPEVTALADRIYESWAAAATASTQQAAAATAQQQPPSTRPSSSSDVGPSAKRMRVSDDDHSAPPGVSSASSSFGGPPDVDTSGSSTASLPMIPASFTSLSALPTLGLAQGGGRKDSTNVAAADGNAKADSSASDAMMFVDYSTGPSTPLSSSSGSGQPQQQQGQQFVGSLDAGAKGANDDDDGAMAEDSTADDDDDWGYGIPPLPVLEIEGNVECGIDESEMGGLLKVKGIGLPDRYGHVKGGILKNRVKGISGGKTIGGESAVISVQGQGKASISSSSSAIKRRVNGGIQWIDLALTAAEAKARHQRIPKASIDGYQHHHLVGVKFFKKEDLPMKISSSAASSSASSLQSASGSSASYPAPAASSGLQHSGAGAGSQPDRRRGVSPSPDAGAGVELDDEDKESAASAGSSSAAASAGDFAAQRLKERLKEQGSVRSALASAASSSLAHTRLLAQGVTQGDKPGLALYHHSKFRMMLRPASLSSGASAPPSSFSSSSSSSSSSAAAPPSIPDVELSEGLKERLATRKVESETAKTMEERIKAQPKAEYACSLSTALASNAPKFPLLDAKAALELQSPAAAAGATPATATMTPMPLPPSNQYMLLPRAPPKPAGAAGALAQGAPTAAQPLSLLGAGSSSLQSAAAAGPLRVPLLGAPAPHLLQQHHEQQQLQLQAQQQRFGQQHQQPPLLLPGGGGAIPIPIPSGAQPSPSPSPPSMHAQQQHQQQFPQGFSQGPVPVPLNPQTVASGAGALPLPGGGLANLLSGLKSLAAGSGSSGGSVAPQVPMSSSSHPSVSGAIPIPLNFPQQQYQHHQQQQHQVATMGAFPSGGVPVRLMPGTSAGFMTGPIAIPLPTPQGGGVGGLLPAPSAPPPMIMMQQQGPHQQPLLPSGAIPIPLGQLGGAGFAGAPGMRPTGTKPCLFFTTPQGCRKGASCPFIHDPGFVPNSDDLKAISKR